MPSTTKGKTQTTKKKTTSSRKPTSTRGKSKRTRSKASQAEKPLSNDLKYELVVLLFIAFSLMLIISVYFNIGGKVGETVRYFMFGAFGISAYVLPIYILGASFLKVFNRDNRRLNNKLSLVFIGIIMVSTFAHILFISDSQINKTITDQRAFFATTALYFEVSAKSHLAGGMVGGVIGDLFEILIGRVGSFIMLVLIFLSLGILITEQSLAMVGNAILAFFKWIGKGIVKGLKGLVNSIKTKIEASNERHEEEEQVQIEGSGGPIRETVQEEGPKSRKGTKFLDRVSLKMSQDKPEQASEAKEKPKKTKAKKSYKVNGVDPFQQIINQEEQALAKEKAKEAKEKPVLVAASDGQQTFTGEVVAQSPEEAVEKGNPVPVEAIQTEIDTQAEEKVYRLPPIELMKEPSVHKGGFSMTDIDAKAEKLVQTLESFGVGAKVIDVSVGPTVTRYELQPDIGVKVSKIVNLQDDIALNLASSGIRIEAPIPGKSAVGIEVPNLEAQSVMLREVIDTKEFKKFPSKIAFALGKDIGGKTMIADIARMPHLLIAGATGSGKSVCVNTLITSILYTATPDEVKLLMIDPKVVELSAYNGIPHLLIPVVTDPKKAAGALNWAVQEMNDRYKLFAAANVRDLKGYNNAVEEHQQGKKLPQIVIIVDELADLMMAAPNDVEDAICRLAQMARAAGLHLIIATQRPSVDVITGLIKANIPSRIAFNVSSGVDSRTIIDSVGAEKLLGKGDMLFYPVGLQKPVRVQGAFIADKEVENIVTFLKDQTKANYDEMIINQISKVDEPTATAGGKNDGFDSHFNEALELVIDKQKASASMIQRYFRVGYNRAARIVDQLHDAGFVGEEEGSKPRKVLITRDEYAAMKEEAAIKAAGNDEAAQEQ